MTRQFSDVKEVMLYLESKLITDGTAPISAKPVQNIIGIESVVRNFLSR